MAISRVIRQSLGDTTHSRPVRRSEQRPPVDLDAAYDVCEQITRAEAPNLYSAIEPLPAYKRRALCAIYAFARRVDTVADGNLHPTAKLWLLAHARAGIPHDGTPRPVDPVLVALRDVKRRFPLPLASLDDLVDGAESEVHGVAHETFGDLVHYCRRVGGSIGRLSVAVLGSRDPAAAARLADDLGSAMQLTNILCDLVEGSARRRTNLPREDLARRNREWYERGLSLLPLLDPRSAASVAAMAGAQESILDRIERSPDRHPGRRRFTTTSFRQRQERVTSWRS